MRPAPAEVARGTTQDRDPETLCQKSRPIWQTHPPASPARRRAQGRSGTPPRPEALFTPRRPVHAPREARGIGNGSSGTRSTERLAVALPLVEEAGRLALEHFRQPIEVENKLGDGAFDPVTAADRGVEALIRAGLSRAWPDSPIQGEEEGFTPGASDWSWIIDPIDGTRAFISGVPAWGILLGLLKDGRPVAGIMRQPYLDETFLGDPSGASLLRAGLRRRCAPRAGPRLGDAILYSTHPEISPTGRAGAASTASPRRCG